MPASRTLRLETPRVFAPLLDPARYKGAFGGRGSAKSHTFAEMLLERCLTHQPTRAVCVREVQRSLEQSVKRLLEDKIKALRLGPYFRVQQSEIGTPQGGLIIFQGMQNHTADSIKSLEGYDIAWVEEAQALSQRSLDLLRPTIRKPGSELWFSWNPHQPSDPVDAFLRGNPPPGAVVVRVGYQDNPWFPDVLRTDMEWDQQRDSEKYAHIWLGEYEQRGEARVFRNWRVDEFETPADATFYLGGDWGFSVDPSVLVRCWLAGRTLYVDREVYLVGCEIDYLPFLFGGTQDRELRSLNQAAWDTIPSRYRQLGGIPDARRWVIVADSARPETISYMKRHGFPLIRAARKGPGSVDEGVEFLKSYDIVVHPRCKHAIDELTLYRYKTDALTGNVLPVLEDKKNHVIDALRYATEGVRKVVHRNITIPLEIPRPSKWAPAGYVEEREQEREEWA